MYMYHTRDYISLYHFDDYIVLFRIQKKKKETSQTRHWEDNFLIFFFFYPYVSFLRTFKFETRSNTVPEKRAILHFYLCSDYNVSRISCGFTFVRVSDIS